MNIIGITPKTLDALTSEQETAFRAWWSEMKRSHWTCREELVRDYPRAHFASAPGGTEVTFLLAPEDAFGVSVTVIFPVQLVRFLRIGPPREAARAGSPSLSASHSNFATAPQ
jgi:hypothetical protein